MPDLFHEQERDGVSYNPYKNFSAADLALYDVRHIATNDGVTLTPTAPGVTYGGPPSNVFHVAANGSDPTLNGNHREFFLQSSKYFKHAEIRSVFFGGGTWADVNNRTQQGHVHRFQKLPNGRFRAYVAWHDLIAGLPTTINVGVWEGDGTVAGLNLFSTNAILTQSSTPGYPVPVSSLTSNVVSMQVITGTPYYHYFRDGDLVDLTTASGLCDLNDVRLTLAFGNLLTAPKTAANVTAINSGGGYVFKQGAQAEFPYVFCSRLLPGGTLQAKLYRLGDPEIAWSLTDNNAVYSASGDLQDHVRPRGAGLHGVMVGHVSGGEFVRFGRPLITQI